MAVSLNLLGLQGRSTLYSHSNFTMQTYAQDTFVSTDSGTNTPLFDGGACILQIYVNGGGFYSETFSGVFQWYPYSTNGNYANDITLNGHGHSNNGLQVYARTLRRAGVGKAAIQVWFNSSGATISISLFANRLAS